MAGRKFEFPEPLEACPNLDRFLVPAAVEKGDERLSNCARKNVLKAKKTLKSQGLEVDKLCNEVVVDAAAGKSFFSYMEKSFTLRYKGSRWAARFLLSESRSLHESL